MRRFEGRSVLVTGGSRGLGRAIAGRFAAEGAALTIVGRKQADLDRAVAELRADGGTVEGLAGDVAETGFCEEVVAATVAREGGVDVLVNNAGVFDEAAFTEIEVERWDYVMAVMLRAPFVLSQHAARSMIDRGGGGAIVNISSLEGRGGDGPYASYTAAKGGLNQLTRQMAFELGPSGIRVNAVSPGYCRTEMAEEALGPELIARMEGGFDRVPLRRLVQPGEVASLVAFLASGEASAISGDDVLVDAGTDADLYLTPSLVEGARPLPQRGSAG